jgi:hypothetical protein
MHARTHAHHMYATEQKVLGTLILVLVLLGGLYFYFLSVSIMNVVAREELLLEVAATHSRIGTLETEYLVKKERITEEVARADGFVALAQKSYIVPDAYSRNLTLRE